MLEELSRLCEAVSSAGASSHMCGYFFVTSRMTSARTIQQTDAEQDPSPGPSVAANSTSATTPMIPTTMGIAMNSELVVWLIARNGTLDDRGAKPSLQPTGWKWCRPAAARTSRTSARRLSASTRATRKLAARATRAGFLLPPRRSSALSQAATTQRSRNTLVTRGVGARDY